MFVDVKSRKHYDRTRCIGIKMIEIGYTPLCQYIEQIVTDTHPIAATSITIIILNWYNIKIYTLSDPSLLSVAWVRDK